MSNLATFLLSDRNLVQVSCFAGGIKSFIIERILHLIQTGIGTAIAHCKSSAHHDRGIFGFKPEHTLNVTDSVIFADPVLANLALRPIML
jgi:hypothetical protein